MGAHFTMLMASFHSGTYFLWTAAFLKLVNFFVEQSFQFIKFSFEKILITLFVNFTILWSQNWWDRFANWWYCCSLPFGNFNLYKKKYWYLSIFTNFNIIVIMCHSVSDLFWCFYFAWRCFRWWLENEGRTKEGEGFLLQFYLVFLAAVTWMLWL